MSTAFEASLRASSGPLHDLLRACQSSELSYRRAADRLHDLSFAEVLLRHAHERARFSREIDTELSSLGVEPPSGRDSGEQLVEALLRGASDVDIVTSCVASDRALLTMYERARVVCLPRDVEAVLERQRAAVTTGITELRTLLAR